MGLYEIQPICKINRSYVKYVVLTINMVMVKWCCHLIITHMPMDPLVDFLVESIARHQWPNL